MFIDKPCGCKGFKRCNRCESTSNSPIIHINECENHKKRKCKDDDHCDKDRCKCNHCDIDEYECKCKYECDHCDKDKCKDEIILCVEEVKGFDFCHKKEELRLFKHCGPISQPCDANFYNHFTSRANLEFSGLIVVKNTGNPACGCSMQVRVTDRAGTEIVATVSPGASVPIFVECLLSLDIACLPSEAELPLPATCRGEVIFDLEYCTTKCDSKHH